MQELVAYTRQKVLHAAAAATAVGQPFNTQGLAVASIQVTGTYSDIVARIQGTIDGVTWENLRSTRNDGQKFGTITANGIYTFPVDVLVEVRVSLIFTTGTSVTITARGSSIASGIATLPAGTPSPSASPSASESPSASVSPSVSPSVSASESPSVSSSVSPSPSA